MHSEGATVELVGPNKPLPPKMIQQVAKDGPLHPEVDKILNYLARGFAVIGLQKKEEKGSDPSLGTYDTETDDNGWFKLAAAPGIYSVRTPRAPAVCNEAALSLSPCRCLCLSAPSPLSPPPAATKSSQSKSPAGLGKQGGLRS